MTSTAPATGLRTRRTGPPSLPSPADRHLPQFDGLWTAGVCKGFIGQSDPLVWKIVGGTLYVFSTAERMPPDAQDTEAVARAREKWGKCK